MSTAYIYTLSDPMTGEVRYVGKTTSPTKRQKCHRYESPSSPHKSRWVVSLVKQGLTPVMNILCEVAEEHWQEVERIFIKCFRYVGFSLTNISLGGEGGAAMSKETRAKIGRAHAGKQISEAMRESIRKQLTGRKLTPLHRLNISRGMMGRKFSLTTRRKISKALLGNQNNRKKGHQNGPQKTPSNC